jgi:hypothetical protein
MGAGGGNTVKPAVVRQPVLIVYVMVVVPAAIAVTIPAASMVATDVLLLAHVPPADVLVNVVVAPGHIPIVPVIASGNGLTVTTANALQPVAS